MLRMVATDNRRARTRPVRSPVNSVTPALSIATSVPPPMAMPTSAAASAGASLTPSPTMATRRPSPRSRCTTSLLRSGSTPASISSMPSVLRHRARGGQIVAGQHHDAQAVAAQRRKRGLRRRLDRIGDRDDAGGAAVDRDIDRGGAVLPRGLGGAVERLRRDVQFSHQHRIAERDRLAVDGRRSRPCRTGEAKSLTSPRLELALVRRR